MRTKECLKWESAADNTEILAGDKPDELVNGNAVPLSECSHLTCRYIPSDFRLVRTKMR